MYIKSVGLGDYVATSAGITAFYNNLDLVGTKRIIYKQNTTHAGSSGNPATYMLSKKAEKK